MNQGKKKNNEKEHHVLQMFVCLIVKLFKVLQLYRYQTNIDLIVEGREVAYNL